MENITHEDITTEDITTEDKATKGKLYCYFGILLGMPTWLTDPGNIDFLIRLGTGALSMTALFFAARYHWYATKEKKERIKRLKEGKDERISE